MDKRRVEVLGHRMAYHEVGEGRPIVFLHGNPTSSHLWRNVIPHLAGHGRCLAPDLIGMGDSERLTPSGPDRYGLAEHQRFVDGFLAAVGVEEAGDAVLVLHDWGSALGFDWASRHPDSVAGIAYMEAIVKPLSWSDWPPPLVATFQALRSPAGEEMVLEQNAFVEQILPGAIRRTLTDDEMAEYRRPFAEPGEHRRPTLSWPRQIPIDGEPADVVARVSAYSEWLRDSPVPKLFVNADPGAILRGAVREYCRGFANQREVTVAGTHFIQEDSPDEIGAAIADWLPS
ncbi:MAG: haloalkane dehalogenase [Pseudonocardia sp.]